MALQDHLRLACLIDGVFQVKVSNIEVNGDSGAQAVETLEGLAGKTPGSKKLEISGTWAVPIGGLEFDFFTAAAVGTYHEVQIPVGAKTIISKGWFQTAGIGQGVNASTEAKMTFIGEFEPPQ